MEQRLTALVVSRVGGLLAAGAAGLAVWAGDGAAPRRLRQRFVQGASGRKTRHRGWESDCRRHRQDALGGLAGATARAHRSAGWNRLARLRSLGQLRREGVHAESSWRDVGDEPMLLASLTGCDVVVSRDRFAGARKLVALGVDVIIADDGLQHLRLARDCEIVVIDGARGFGNGRLLPAGPLREPASRVRNAGIVVVNGTPEHASLRGGVEGSLQMSLFGGEAHRVDGLAAPEPLEHFRGRRVHAVAGIGNPQRFFRDLRARGLELVEHPFPDHHPFTAADLTFGDDLPVLMTQKDAVRCREIEDARLWYVPVVARFSEPQAKELLDRVVLALAPGE